MVVPPRVAPRTAAAAPRWSGGWLPAADLPLDEERAATISFDRRGRCRLTLALDRPATDADLAALEEAADVLPNLYLFDLDETADYPERHAEAFGLPEPLAPDAFNHIAEVELQAPPGGPPLPRHLGRFGVRMVGAVDNQPPTTRPWATLPVRGPTDPGRGGVGRACSSVGDPPGSQAARTSTSTSAVARGWRRVRPGPPGRPRTTGCGSCPAGRRGGRCGPRRSPAGPGAGWPGRARGGSRRSRPARRRRPGWARRG